MRVTIFLALIAAALISVAATPHSTYAAPQKKEYLSDEEADKIREAETPNLRVKLYLSFAADRLKKFQYQLDRTLPQSRRGETLNGLLNAYSGCIDDAADIISLAVEKQQEIRAGIKEMQSKGKEYLGHAGKTRKEPRRRPLQRHPGRRNRRHQRRHQRRPTSRKRNVPTASTQATIIMMPAVQPFLSEAPGAPCAGFARGVVVRPPSASPRSCDSHLLLSQISNLKSEMPLLKSSACCGISAVGATLAACPEPRRAPANVNFLPTRRNLRRLNPVALLLRSEISNLKYFKFKIPPGRSSVLLPSEISNLKSEIAFPLPAPSFRISNPPQMAAHS